MDDINHIVHTSLYAHRMLALCSLPDFDKKIITCRGIFDNEIFTLNYDKLVLAQGVKTNTFNTPNVAEREGNEVFFLKNLHHARGIR